MRPVWILILTASLCLLFSGCSPKGETDGKRVTWTSVSPEFDRAVELLEKAYVDPTPYYRRDSLTRSLGAGPEPAATAQRCYWQARLARAGEDHRLADSLVGHGLESIDSAAFPYEWARLISMKASLSTASPNLAYELSSDNLRYFKSINDTLMVGSTLMRLGAVMWSINDTVPASRYYMMADSVFTVAGPEIYRLKNLVNIANTLDRPETIGRRDSIMSLLLASPIIRSDSTVYNDVLRNSYFNTGDFDYMRRAYAVVCDAPERRATRAKYLGEMADYFIGYGFPEDSVKKYALMAYADIDKVEQPLARATIFNAMACAAYIDKDYDSSVLFYQQFLNERLSVEKEHFSLETTKADYRAGFEQARREEQMRHAREREIWITALVLACCLAVAIWVILYFRMANARMKHQQTEIQLQQNRNYFTACALAIDEKDRIIDSLVKSVDKMHSEGKIAGSEAKELTANVRRSLNNNLERETFTELHKKLHPEFMRRLKKDYPMLTESQLKHAAYIAMGLSSKQISQILNIEYESVKKSRTRLRARMGLAPDSSLEDTLRSYASTD